LKYTNVKVTKIGSSEDGLKNEKQNIP
jgi:hypothetical protein